MSRSSLYLVIAALVAVVIGLLFYIYGEQNKARIEIRLDERGITVDGSGLGE